MRTRYLSVVALVACGVLAPVATTAATAAGHTKPAAEHVSPARPAKPARPARPVKFAASGTVSAVDGATRTITVVVKHGASDLRGTTTTFSLAPAARVTVNDSQAALTDVQAGYRVAVRGVETGSVYTAARVDASAPRPQPQPSTTTEPTEAP